MRFSLPPTRSCLRLRSILHFLSLSLSLFLFLSLSLFLYSNKISKKKKKKEAFFRYEADKQKGEEKKEEEKNRRWELSQRMECKNASKVNIETNAFYAIIVGRHMHPLAKWINVNTEPNDKITPIQPNKLHSFDITYLCCNDVVIWLYKL